MKEIRGKEKNGQIYNERLISYSPLGLLPCYIICHDIHIDWGGMGMYDILRRKKQEKTSKNLKKKKEKKKMNLRPRHQSTPTTRGVDFLVQLPLNPLTVHTWFHYLLFSPLRLFFQCKRQPCVSL